MKHEPKFLNVYLECCILSYDKSLFCTYLFVGGHVVACLHFAVINVVAHHIQGPRSLSTHSSLSKAMSPDVELPGDRAVNLQL